MTTIVTAAGLARDVQAFLRFKRAMGFGYRRAELTLNAFVRFVEQHWGSRVKVSLDEAVCRAA